MSVSLDIAGLRKDYSLRSFSEQDESLDPFIQFSKWWEEAEKSEILEYNAMTLCSCTKGGIPSARIVLLKGFDENGFTFYTNYDSKKGKEVIDNPNVALVFFWKDLERQIRIEGTAVKTTAEQSDAYFAVRPIKSQIGAIASSQSEIIPDRAFLENSFDQIEKKYSSIEIPRPPQWGGFTIQPNLFEFWQGRRSRLHDRLQYTMTAQKQWVINRLAP